MPKFSWTEEPGGLHPVCGVTRVGCDWRTAAEHERATQKSFKGLTVPLLRFFDILLQPMFCEPPGGGGWSYLTLGHREELVVRNIHRGKYRSSIVIVIVDVLE